MPEIIRDEIRKARKAHTCDLCSKGIHPGETYRYSFNKDGGTAYPFSTHLQCWKIATALWEWFDPDEGISEGHFEDDLREYCWRFVCPHCQKWSSDDGCTEDMNAGTDCLDIIVERLKTYKLVKEGRDGWMKKWVEVEIKAQTGREDKNG